MYCYLCNSNSFAVRKGTVRDNPKLKILECNDCGLVTLSSNKHIQDGFYEHSKMHGDTLTPMDIWIKNSYSDDMRHFNNLKPFLKNKKLLDFGCGAGGFLNQAKQVTSLAEGLELELRVKEYWSDSINIYQKLGLVDHQYDLITAFHVVEHLIDPITTLRMLSKKLLKNGRIVIEVPSSEDILLTLYDSKSFQNFSYWSQHLFLFNMDSLQNLIKKAHLKVISIEQFQRYPLSNHLYWLSQEKHDGHKVWNFLDSPDLQKAYSDSLAKIGKCDTIIAHLTLEN